MADFKLVSSTANKRLYEVCLLKLSQNELQDLQANLFSAFPSDNKQYACMLDALYDKLMRFRNDN